MYSEESREMFRIISAGRYTLDKGFYFGYAFSMFHFAGKIGNENVTDNLLVNPYAGWEFNAYFDFDIKAGLFAPSGAQHRVGMEKQKGAQIDFVMTKWGVKLENNLYLGENLQPFRYAYVGEPLYAGEQFYSTTDHIYNRTWIGYDRRFFKGTMGVEAGMVFHYDGSGMGTQQMVKLSVDIQKLFNIGPKAKNKNTTSETYGKRNKRNTGEVAELPRRDHRRVDRQGRNARTDPFPARTERLPAYRTRQEHLHQLRTGEEIRRQVQPALRRHEPRQGGRRIRRFDQARHPLARLRLGRRALCVGLFRPALRLGRGPHQKGLAYVDDQTQEQIRENRGTVSVPGTPSPWRDRSVEENLDLFERMKKGEFADGEKVLRAKIDMAHPNMLFRDPIMYRIIHAEHHRTGNKWCIYPMYDYAHGQSDSIEQITHSICTLEFDVHRPLYDWFIQALEIFLRISTNSHV